MVLIHALEQFMPNLGKVDSLESVIETHEIEEVIIAIGSGDHAILGVCLKCIGRVGC